MTPFVTMLAATAVFTQMQLKYGAQRNDFLHRWYERPLHQDTSYADASDGSFLNVPAWKKTVETLRLGRMDGVAFFAAKQDRRWDVLEKSLIPGGETQVLFELSAAAGFDGYIKAAERAFGLPNHLRIGGRTVLPVRYAAESCPPEFCARLKAALTERFGDRYLLLPYGVVFPKTTDGVSSSPATMERARSRVREILRAGDGFFYQGREGFVNRRFDRQLFESTVARVIREVFAEDEFKGRKLLGSNVTLGHENDYRWQYGLDSNGTATLCDRLESLVPLKPDLLICTEWDEENENSHFRPTVANGHTTQRIVRHFADRLAGRAPAPFPGDDTSIPNLILSYRKALMAGEQVEVEVRNLPDSTFSGEVFKVSFRWRAADGRVVREYPAQKLMADVQSAVRFVAPATELLEERILLPELSVAWNGGARIFSEGLFAMDLNAVRNIDHKWVKQALRECPIGVTGELELGTCDANGVYVVRGRVASPKALRSVEVLDDMDSAYMHGENPSVPNGFERIRFEFSGLDKGDAALMGGTIRFRNAPSVRLTPNNGLRGDRAAVMNGAWRLEKCRCDNWGLVLWAAVPAVEMSAGEIDIDLPPRFKGTVRLADLLRRDAVGFNAANGCGLSVMRYLATPYLPRPLMTSAVEFTFRWKPIEPTSVLRLQAIDADYRVWNGPARTVYRPSGRRTTISVFDRDRAATVSVDLDVARLPEIACDLSGKDGAVLSLGGGRALSGMVGASATLAQAFGKGESQYGNPLHRHVGRLSLKDAALPTRGWGCLSLQTVPCFAGFELEMKVKPAGFGRRQGLLNSGNCGIDLFIAPDGTLKANLAAGNGFMVAKTHLAVPVEGPRLKDCAWNTIRLVTDRRTAYIEVDGARGPSVRYEDYFFNQRYTLFGAVHPKGEFFVGELGMMSVRYR